MLVRANDMLVGVEGDGLLLSSKVEGTEDGDDGD